MAPPVRATHVVFSGVMPGGEEFAFGYWAILAGVPANAAAFQLTAANIMGASTTALQNIANTCFSSDTRILQGDAYYYDGSGTKAAFQAQATFNLAGTGGPSLPNQCAVVATLLTGVPGRSQRGRMYIPLTATTGDTTRGFQTSATRTQGASQQVAELLRQCNINGARASVVSTTKGTSLPITSVRADSKIDTQRRRAEQVSAVTITTTAVLTA